MNSLPQIKRIRWAVRAVLLLGVAASVAGNVLHAQDNIISQVISAWSPLALLLTVELISRVPVHTRLLAFTRMAATAVIAGIAAWVSYWHMVAVASSYGETDAAPYLLPLSVDGLIVVASICLVELGGRISAVTMPATTAVTDVVDPPATVAQAPTVDLPEGVTTDDTAEPVSEPVKPRAKRTTPKTLTAADKVAKVAAKNPDATNAEIARKVGVSERTVVRHRPRAVPVAEAAANLGTDPAVVADLYAARGYDTDGTPIAPPSGPDAAETLVNGHSVDLVEVNR